MIAKIFHEGDESELVASLRRYADFHDILALYSKLNVIPGFQLCILHVVFFHMHECFVRICFGKAVSTLKSLLISGIFLPLFKKILQQFYISEAHFFGAPCRRQRAPLLFQARLPAVPLLLYRAHRVLLAVFLLLLRVGLSRLLVFPGCFAKVPSIYFTSRCATPAQSDPPPDRAVRCRSPRRRCCRPSAPPQ